MLTFCYFFTEIIRYFFRIIDIVLLTLGVIYCVYLFIKIRRWFKNYGYVLVLLYFPSVNFCLTGITYIYYINIHCALIDIQNFIFYIAFWKILSTLFIILRYYRIPPTQYYFKYIKKRRKKQRTNFRLLKIY